MLDILSSRFAFTLDSDCINVYKVFEWKKMKIPR